MYTIDDGNNQFLLMTGRALDCQHFVYLVAETTKQHIKSVQAHKNPVYICEYLTN